MSFDTNGDDIRTWTLNTGVYGSQIFTYNYFRLIEPSVDPATGEFDFEYSGGINNQDNAYGAFIDDPTLGHSVEIDQFVSNPSPDPASPVCPADKCGIALQQQQENVVVANVLIGRLNPSTSPRFYHAWLWFNHPLYFRREFTVTTVILKETAPPPPAPPVPDLYIVDTYPVNPTDINYATDGSLNASYFVATNSVFTFSVPASTATDKYTFSYYFVSEVESND